MFFSNNLQLTTVGLSVIIVLGMAPCPYSKYDKQSIDPAMQPYYMQAWASTSQR